ncbi:hypothetical protein B5X24_HaOG211505 [Helicoverpa armigera]|nr:hypothetical protein B5X24_HaOG211505 [Helicoverpa armigera]
MNNMLIRAALSNIKKKNLRYMATKVEDVLTHTGQKWDSHDYRMARFMNSPKVVNPNWAVKLVAEVPAKQVTERIAWCDGGVGSEGHPRVYINLDRPGDNYCNYCSQRFVRIENH